MEAVIFCGIQASGKTTFYIQEFFNTHIRISLDQLNTRNKEKLFINTCLEIQQRFVVDNTNPTKQERKRYIDLARAKKFKVICYYFKAKPKEALSRNLKRAGKEKIPEVGIRGTYKRLETPKPEEGFDDLYYVEIKGDVFKISKYEESGDGSSSAGSEWQELR